MIKERRPVDLAHEKLLRDWYSVVIPTDHPLDEELHEKRIREYDNDKGFENLKNELPPSRNVS